MCCLWINYLTLQLICDRRNVKIQDGIRAVLTRKQPQVSQQTFNKGHFRSVICRWSSRHQSLPPPPSPAPLPIRWRIITLTRAISRKPAAQVHRVLKEPSCSEQHVSSEVTLADEGALRHPTPRHTSTHTDIHTHTTPPGSERK